MLSHLHFYLLSLVLVAFLPISLLKHSLPLEAHNLRGGILTNPSQSRVKKIAVLSIYIARSLPVWFNLFASTVESNKEYFDWFIFTMDDFNLRPSKPLPSNIIIITLTSHVLSHLLSMVDENYRAAYAVRNATHTARVRDVIQNIIREFPYALVEFKPALADIFHEYIKQYSHFAYADMDVLLGDWSILPWDKVFESYNFVSITFGDHYSLYLRGQMTIFQNTLRTRLLYRRCLHLTEFSTRGEKYMTASPHKWQLQSAEGCISWGAHEEGLSILYLPLQRSDAYKGGKGEGAVLVKDSEQDRLKLVYCQSLLPNISSSADTITHNILDIPSWNEMIRHGQRAQVQIGAKAASARCSYWIDPQYDVCALSHIPATAIIAVKMQQVYYMNISHPLIHDADTHGLLGQLARFVDTAKGKVLCYESLLFHMQVLKRGLFQSASGLADETDAVVITSAGLIPYRISNSLMTIQGRDQQYCLRYDSKLLHCECILPASSIHVTVSTEQRKQADEQAESPHSTRVVFAPALPFPLTVYGTANSCIVSISPPSCSSSIIRTPFLFNVYLDQIRAKGKTGVDIWTMKLSLTPASSVVVLFSQGDKDINELVGKLDRVDDGLVVLVQSTTVILQHLLRFPDELLNFPLRSSCPLLQLYLPHLVVPSATAASTDDFLLLLLHFHMLGMNITALYARRNRGLLKSVHNASTVTHTLDICISAASAPYDKFMHAWKAYIKKSDGITARGLASIVVRADRDSLVSMSSVGRGQRH